MIRATIVEIRPTELVVRTKDGRILTVQGWYDYRYTNVGDEIGLQVAPPDLDWRVPTAIVKGG